MTRNRKTRGFQATWALPILAGPALTAGALVWLDKVAASGDWERSAAVETVEPLRGSAPLRLTERFEPAPLGPPPSLPAAPAEPKNLYARVTVLDAGRFRTIVDGEKLVIALHGVRPLAFDERCTDEKGNVWRCGGRARAELAKLIQTKSIGCDPVEGLPITEQRCQVAGRDLAGWLVSQGWADPADPADPALAPLQEEAKRNKRGRYGPAPIGVIAG